MFCLTWEGCSILSCHLANPFPPVTYNFRFLVCSFVHPEDICVDPSCKQLLLWSCKRRVKKNNETWNHILLVWDGKIFYNGFFVCLNTEWYALGFLACSLYRACKAWLIYTAQHTSYSIKHKTICWVLQRRILTQKFMCKSVVFWRTFSETST